MTIDVSRPTSRYLRPSCTFVIAERLCEMADCENGVRYKREKALSRESDDIDKMIGDKHKAENARPA